MAGNRWKAALAALLLCCSASVLADSQGRVVGVSDEDTVKVLTSSKELLKVRLLGIDAPEKAQPFGNRSGKPISKRPRLRQASHGRMDQEDRYGRVVGNSLMPVGRTST